MSRSVWTAARFAAAIGAALFIAVGIRSVSRAQLIPPSPGTEASRGPASHRWFSLDGYLRIRGDMFYNLDLDRGPTPAGVWLFPLPAARPNRQVLETADTRLRLEPVLQISRTIRVLARVDVLDNIVLGSTPEGLPRDPRTPMVGASVAQSSPVSGKNAIVDAVAVKRAWGEVLLPFGLLAVGRQGAILNWGTGFFVNSSSHLDADGNDAADRIMFATSLLRHLWLFAFDWSAVGPTSAAMQPAGYSLNLERRDDVHTLSFGFARYDTDAGVRRKTRGGTFSLNYGLLGAYRWQKLDAPAYYDDGGYGEEYGPPAYLKRNLKTATADLWFRFVSRSFRVEFEAALLYSRVGNASLDPSVVIRQAITSMQYGGVLKVAFTPLGGRLVTGLEAGLASGDRAPGFGVAPPLNQLRSVPGDIDGPQFSLPSDTTVNNFRFHPDYHIDLILWRRIIGTVSDAFYFRPYVRWNTTWGLSLEGVLIGSFAVYESTTPGGKVPLGIELDLGASYRYDEAFVIRLALGVLFPLAGLDNPQLGLDAEPATTLHTVMAYVF